MKKNLNELVSAAAEVVDEIFPWDLDERLQEKNNILLIDVSEPYEYDKVHIAGSINVPRGVLESACEYNFEETVPALADARDQDVVIICRSGNRSVLAALTMNGLLGYRSVSSLKTGLRGWNDFELKLIDKNEKPVDIDLADEYFMPNLRPEQEAPQT
ncbi:MAG: rhodanese-like domain-containing protein [Gammaproteobacteria bacterium]|nr:rhodanese-like domain-containing protein [Gammaproteobacteria bacterium]